MPDDLDGNLTEDQGLGRRLREAREDLGFTQEEVSAALRIPRTSVHAMEAGKRKVTAGELRRLGRLYERSIEWLLGEADPVVGADNALFRATSVLSDDDKAQVLQFAKFLASGSPKPTSRE